MLACWYPDGRLYRCSTPVITAYPVPGAPPALGLRLWEGGSGRPANGHRPRRRCGLISSPRRRGPQPNPVPPRQLDADTAARLLSTRTPPRGPGPRTPAPAGRRTHHRDPPRRPAHRHRHHRNQHHRRRQRHHPDRAPRHRRPEGDVAASRATCPGCVGSPRWVLLGHPQHQGPDRRGMAGGLRSSRMGPAVRDQVGVPAQQGSGQNGAHRRGRSLSGAPSTARSSQVSLG